MHGLRLWRDAYYTTADFDQRGALGINGGAERRRGPRLPRRRERREIRRPRPPGASWTVCPRGPCTCSRDITSAWATTARRVPMAACGAWFPNGCCWARPSMFTIRSIGSEGFGRKRFLLPARSAERGMRFQPLARRFEAGKKPRQLQGASWPTTLNAPRPVPDSPDIQTGADPRRGRDRQRDADPRRRAPAPRFSWAESAKGVLRSTATSWSGRPSAPSSGLSSTSCCGSSRFGAATCGWPCWRACCSGSSSTARSSACSGWRPERNARPGPPPPTPTKPPPTDRSPDPSAKPSKCSSPWSFSWCCSSRSTPRPTSSPPARWPKRCWAIRSGSSAPAAATASPSIAAIRSIP